MHVSMQKLRKRIKRKKCLSLIGRAYRYALNFRQEDKRLIIILVPDMSSDSHQLWVSIDNESNQVS